MVKMRKRLLQIFIFLIILLSLVRNCECNCKPKKSSNNRIDCGSDDNVLLSRKKRALTFPPGSSLQLAYDQTMPIAAAQLLFTIGVTVALAFELPDKPIGRITQELRDSLQKRLHPSSTTAAPDTSNSSDSDHSRIDYNSNNLKYIYNNKQAYYNNMNKHKYYYGNYGFKDRIDDNKPSTNKSAINDDDVESKKVVKTYTNKDGQKVITMKIKYGKKKKKLGNLFLRKHNRVYPVFGKRSIDDNLTHDRILYLDHHRNSRFDAYEKIENFLIGQGKNGTGCVLRALCETAQKNQNNEKAPFLIEILRAIFTLPHQVMPYKKDLHHAYDDAHSNLSGDCAELYPQCKDSIWSSDFRF
ncbi:uncharacterized protein [Chironomus tepperi]|uniref:uncharacterized protein n=1 Tax=Chironomus tepperi TaxID=113505 RepID=UPI00391F6561